MSDNKRNAVNKAKRPYLLSGLIECEACGAAYVGHTTTSGKGYETRYYVCGNKYRTHTCTAKNINAEEIETFVMQQLKAYLLATDFEAEAQRIADQINNSTPELTAERAERASVTAQINNGLRAILNGMDIPELRDEMDKLRVRKSELEDIIGRRTARRQPVDPKSIVQIYEESLENWDTNLPEIVKQHVTKIYAHTDGSVSVNVGVHINGASVHNDSPTNLHEIKAFRWQTNIFHLQLKIGFNKTLLYDTKTPITTDTITRLWFRNRH